MKAYLYMILMTMIFTLNGCGSSVQVNKIPVSDSTSVGFIGDTIVYDWNLQSFGTSVQVIKFGVHEPNSTTKDLLESINDILASSLGTVVILAGTDDIRLTASTDSTNVESMATIARAASVRVILCQLPPLHDPIANARVVKFNLQLITFAKANSFYLVDLYTPMIDSSGDQNPALFVNDIPNAAGYQIMNNTLAPELTFVQNTGR
jgi:lysophospholipase L1-like esterase